MNQINYSFVYLLIGGTMGGVLGFASYLWLLTLRPPLAQTKLVWAFIASLIITALATLAGAMIGLATERIRRDLKSGGSVWPYLRVAGQYFAIGLFVLLIRGNRHFLDLAVMPSLSAIAGVVLYGLVDSSQKTSLK